MRSRRSPRRAPPNGFPPLRARCPRETPALYSAPPARPSVEEGRSGHGVRGDPEGGGLTRAPAEPRRLRQRARELELGRRQGRARPPRRDVQPRPRVHRPARERRSGIQDRDDLRVVRRRDRELHVRRHEARIGQVRERPDRARHREGGSRLLLHGPHPGAVLRGLRHAQARRDHRAAVLRLRPRGRSRARAARRGCDGDHDAQPAAEDRRDPRRSALVEARDGDRPSPGRRDDRGQPRLPAADGGRLRGFRDRADRSGRLVGHALHLGHHRPAEGCGARTQRRARPLRDRQARDRLAPGGHLLVHGRPGLGHRDQLSHVRSLVERGDEPRLRGRLRGGTLVRGDPAP